MNSLRDKACELSAEGLAVIPLRKNADGFAKIPMLAGWQTTTPADVALLDWTQAEGVGLVLGAGSGNRSAIDIDDIPLANDACEYVQSRGLYPLMTRTARGRLHLHVVEPEASPSRALRLVYRGTRVGVELKATGTQVAIPPTPGYSWINEHSEPLYGSLREIWSEIANALGVTLEASVSSRGSAGYPLAFQQRVARGERNNAIFVEGCCLARTGVAFERALDFMLKRVEVAYEPGCLSQREISRTLRSAYARVMGVSR